MNLDQLRQKILGQTTTETVGDATYRLSKIGAVDGLKINALMLSLPMKGEGDKKTLANDEDLPKFYAFMLSKCIVDEAANKTLDSDEGRGLLERMERSELFELAEKATDWNSSAQKKT